MPILHEPTAGTALWLYAHPRRESLNHRLLQAGTDSLSARYQVENSDLYAQGFNPLLGDHDLGEPLGKPGNIATLAGEAYARGELPPEVQAEQAKLAVAELLVIQFPLWWYGPPAILKGWFDRVLTAGFAHGDLDPELGVPRRYGDGPFVGRRALIVVTVGEDRRSVGRRGISGDLDSLLFPITHGTLWFMGIETLALHVVYDADGLDQEDIQKEVARLRARLENLESETPRSFRRLRDGDYEGTRALREDLLPDRTDFDIHLTEPPL